MTASPDRFTGALEQLARAMLENVEQTAARAVARMQESLPSYARVPAGALGTVTLTNLGRVLEALLDPSLAKQRRDEHFRVSGEARLGQGITAEEMLQAWRIGLEVLREEAHPVAARLGLGDDVLLAFVEATLQWGDIGMRVSAAAHRGGEIRELERLAAEQAALRRVATLAARGALADEIFDAVAAELAGLLQADHVVVCRYESGSDLTVLANRGKSSQQVPPGTRIDHEGDSVEAVVWRTERSARLESYEGARGTIAELARAAGVHVAVGAPVVVDGRLWGVASAGWSRGRPPPANAEERMAKFAELLDTAIANADSRDQLTASRARLLTEADQARRRVVRDLHDGAQQRLLHAVITLRFAQDNLPANPERAAPLVAEALWHAQQGNAELRELAHGILPAVLSDGGLRAGIAAVVSRLDLPIAVDVPSQRFPETTEASAYFIVAEALTNVVKHAHANSAEVRIVVDGPWLRILVSDDGVGGADRNGHGLIGLADRASTLGGTLELESPMGSGTALTAALPLTADDLRAPSNPNARPAPWRVEVYSSHVAGPLRVVIGEDDVLLREGIVRLLEEAGLDVVAQTGDAEAFLRRALGHRPDVTIVDVHMPPGHGDDGLQAALELRRQRPETAVLVLSNYYEQHYAASLMGDSARGVGYLLKERVGDVQAFIEAVNRVAAGGTALDPEVVSRMLRRPNDDGPLAVLTERERDVLAAMAEGKSNRGIAEALLLAQASVEKHITAIFEKLQIEPAPTDHRRVLAVLAYLRFTD